MQSALYQGWVRHRRHAPTQHDFRFPLFMVLMDLDELPGVFDELPGWSARGPALAWFRRRDHFGDAATPLRDVVNGLLRQTLSRPLTGAVRLLTHLRYFGYCFNPISCFYCYRADGRLDAIIAEVNNTWGRRHCYVLDAERAESRPGGWHCWHTDKVLHVSPFMPLEQRYEWRFREPADQLALHMASTMAPADSTGARHEGSAGRGTKADGEHVPRSPPQMFDATLNLERHELDRASARQVLVKYPLMTLQVIGAIHLEALKLWRKKTPVFPDPHAGDTVKETPEIRP